jgi:hypothetical protein
MNMEEMKINSKRGYTRSRIIRGHGPHRILEMKRQELLERIAKEQSSDGEVSK